MINNLLYVEYIEETTTNIKKDLNDIKDVKKLYTDDNSIINLEKTLQFIYNKLYKSPKDIEKIISKYDGWYYIMFQRIYKKYENEDYQIIKEPDTNSDYTFM